MDHVLRLPLPPKCPSMDLAMDGYHAACRRWGKEPATGEGALDGGVDSQSEIATVRPPRRAR